MPNRFTFKIPTVQNILARFMNSGHGWADPFANDHSRAEHTNDINPNTNASKHLDAVEFLRTFVSDSLNGVLLDPPYSMHQSTVTYKTKRMIRLTPVFDEAARVVKPLGHVITFGWNSNGVARGFDLLEVVLIPHGGHHNDTIVTIEQKLSKEPMLIT